MRNCVRLKFVEKTVTHNFLLSICNKVCPPKIMFFVNYAEEVWRGQTGITAHTTVVWRGQRGHTTHTTVVWRGRRSNTAHTTLVWRGQTFHTAHTTVVWRGQTGHTAHTTVVGAARQATQITPK